MNLHNVRKELQETLKVRGLSQFDFAKAYDLSYSSINKFLNGHGMNPRIQTVEKIERAIKREKARAAS